jgi:hypothetical protein
MWTSQGKLIKIFIFFKIYYHTQFQDPTWCAKSVIPTSKVHSYLAGAIDSRALKPTRAGFITLSVTTILNCLKYHVPTSHSVCTHSMMYGVFRHRLYLVDHILPSLCVHFLFILLFGLPLFHLPVCKQFKIFWGNLSSPILRRCPYQTNCFIQMSSRIVFLNPIFSNYFIYNLFSSRCSCWSASKVNFQSQ